MLALLEKSLRSVSLYAPVGYFSQTCNSMFSVTFINEKSDTPHNFFPQNCVQGSPSQSPQKKADDFLRIASNVVHDFFNHDTSTVPNKTAFMVNTNKHVSDVLDAKVEGMMKCIQKFETHKPALVLNSSKIAHRYNLLLSFNHSRNFRKTNHSLRSYNNHQHDYLVLSKPCNLVTMNQKTIVGSTPFLTFVRFNKNQVPAKEQTSTNSGQINKTVEVQKLITKGVAKKPEESKKLDKKKSKVTLSMLRNILLFFSKPQKLMLKSKPTTTVSNNKANTKATDKLAKPEDTSSNVQTARNQSSFLGSLESTNQFQIKEREWPGELKPGLPQKAFDKKTSVDTKIEPDVQLPPRIPEIFKDERYKVKSIEYVPYNRRKLERVPSKLARNQIVVQRNEDEQPLGLTSYFFGKKLKGLSVLRNFKKRKLHTIVLIRQPMLRTMEADIFLKSQKVCFSNTKALRFKKEGEEEEEEAEEAEVEELTEVESPYAISYDAETAFEEEAEEAESAEESDEPESRKIESSGIVNEIEKGTNLNKNIDYNEDDSVNRDIEIDDTFETKFSELQPNLNTLLCDLTMGILPAEGIAGHLKNIWKSLGYPYGMDLLTYHFQSDFLNQTAFLLNINRNLSNCVKKLTDGKIDNNDGLIHVKQLSTCSSGNEPPKADYRDGIFADLPYILVCDPEYEEKVSQRAGKEYKTQQYFLYHCYSFYDFFNYLALCRAVNPPSCCC